VTDHEISPTSPRVTVAFAMFCQGYDPERPTDLRQMTTDWSPRIQHIVYASLC
jgi:hypothetical protein